MSSNAKISAVGNLVHDPVMKRVNDADVCNIVVAVNTKRKPDGTYKANFYDCSLWDDLGKQYYPVLQKGAKVLFYGDLDVAEKKNLAGENVARLYVKLNDITVLYGARRRENNNDSTPPTDTTEENKTTPDENADDTE